MKGPCKLIFDQMGGYDCMTGAWRIEDCNGNVIARIDQADYGQPRCDYGWFSAEAENDALLLFSVCPNCERTGYTMEKTA